MTNPSLSGDWNSAPAAKNKCFDLMVVRRFKRHCNSHPLCGVNIAYKCVRIGRPDCACCWPAKTDSEVMVGYVCTSRNYALHISSPFSFNWFVWFDLNHQPHQIV